MGYDMYWVEHPEEMSQAYAAAQVEFQARVQERDAGTCTQAAVEEAFASMCDAEGYYFRLNIWGMSEAREWLLKVGAVHKRGDHPPFPDTEGLDDDAYEEAVKSVLSAGVEFPGIPMWKLCSNNGWIVTPIECESAARIARERSDLLVGAPEFVPEFIDWIAAAVKHGGFEVN